MVVTPDEFSPEPDDAVDVELDGVRCTSKGNPENLEKPNLANLKHSMYARDDTIRETMIEEEVGLYDWIMSWADVYDINIDTDPSAYHDLMTLAIETVGQSRTSYLVLTNTEVTQEGVDTPDGQLLEQRDVPNPPIDAHQAQIRLIAKINDTLNITRKQQKHDEHVEDANSSMDTLAGALSNLVGEDSEYDTDEFEDND